MEKMIEQPQPPEGDEATTGTMSPLAAVLQYLSTNSAKRTFLHNSGLVVMVSEGVLDHYSDFHPQMPTTYPQSLHQYHA